MEEDETRFFAAGYCAAELGKMITACPNSFHPKFTAAWRAGYMHFKNNLEADKQFILKGAL